MSLFDLLVVSHFVGDWMFQTNWMADNKRGRPFGTACVLHCLIYTVVVGAGLWLAGAAGIAHLSLLPATGAVVFIYLTHWLIDGFNLPRRWSNLFNRTDKEFVLVVLDQTLHLVTLALLAWWLAGD